MLSESQTEERVGLDGRVLVPFSDERSERWRYWKNHFSIRVNTTLCKFPDTPRDFRSYSAHCLPRVRSSHPPESLAAFCVSGHACLVLLNILSWSYILSSYCVLCNVSPTASSVHFSLSENQPGTESIRSFLPLFCQKPFSPSTPIR